MGAAWWGVHGGDLSLPTQRVKQVGYLVPMSYGLTPRGRMLRGYCDFSAGFSLVSEL